MMFHLINLPTPRRRMAYPYQARRPQADRRREISQRTMDAVLAAKRRLTQAELAMLPQLDAQVISQFVGPYFKAVPDRPLKAGDGYPSLFTTEHEVLCSALVDIGTHEAIDALEKAAIAREADTASPPAQYPVAWIAALAIAQRDPWDGMDAWLARLVERDTPLTRGGDPVPGSLGAVPRHSCCYSGTINLRASLGWSKWRTTCCKSAESPAIVSASPPTALPCRTGGRSKSCVRPNSMRAVNHSVRATICRAFRVTRRFAADGSAFR